MTKRGLIIGDSHAAALRQAATLYAEDWPGLTLDFAAMHGDMANFCIKDGALTARRKEDRARLARISGRDEFPLAGYDFVAVCGGAPSNFHAVWLYLKARWPGLPSVARAKLHRQQDWTLLSEACFEATLAQLMQRSGAFGLLHQLAEAGLTRRFLIPMPLLSHSGLSAGTRYQGFLMLNQLGDTLAMAGMLDRAFLRACSTTATPIPWPQSVRLNGFFARPEFRRGATRLGPGDAVPQPDDDFLHANAGYGRHILAALVQQL